MFLSFFVCLKNGSLSVVFLTTSFVFGFPLLSDGFWMGDCGVGIFGCFFYTWPVGFVTGILRKFKVKF